MSRWRQFTSSASFSAGDTNSNHRNVCSCLRPPLPSRKPLIDGVDVKQAKENKKNQTERAAEKVARFAPRRASNNITSPRESAADGQARSFFVARGPSSKPDVAWPICPEQTIGREFLSRRLAITGSRCNSISSLISSSNTNSICCRASAALSAVSSGADASMPLAFSTPTQTANSCLTAKWPPLILTTVAAAVLILSTRLIDTSRLSGPHLISAVAASSSDSHRSLVGRGSFADRSQFPVSSQQGVAQPELLEPAAVAVDGLQTLEQVGRSWRANRWHLGLAEGSFIKPEVALSQAVNEEGAQLLRLKRTIELVSINGSSSSSTWSPEVGVDQQLSVSDSTSSSSRDRDRGLKLRALELPEAIQLINGLMPNSSRPVAILKGAFANSTILVASNSSQVKPSLKLVGSNELVSSEKVRAYHVQILFIEHLETHDGRQLVLAANKSHLMVLVMLDPFFHWEAFQSALAVIILILVLAGNTSILFRLRSRERRKSNVNFFIVQLAIADLLVGVVCIVSDLKMRLERSFNYGEAACIANRYLAAVLLFSSSYLLVAMSFDRWQAVVRPLALTWNRKNRHLMVTGAWLLSFLLALPPAFHTKIKSVEDLPQCWVDFGIHWRTYLVYLTMMLLVVPTILIAICYVDIVLTIVQRSRESDLRLCQVDLTVGEQSKEIEDKALGKHRVAARGSKSSTDGRVEEPAMIELQPEGEIATGELRQEASEASDDDDYSDDYDDDGHRSDGASLQEKVVTAPSDRSAIVLTTRLSSEPGKPTSSIIKVTTRPNLSLSPDMTTSTETEGSRMRPQNSQNKTGKPKKTIKQVKPKYRAVAGRQNNSGVIPKARVKTTKMTFVIVAAYVLCWTPFCIINNMIVFELIDRDSSITIALGTMSSTLTHLNSAVNPIIYWLFSSRRSAKSKKNDSSGTGFGLQNNNKSSLQSANGHRSRNAVDNGGHNASMISTETVASDFRTIPVVT